MHCTRLLRAVSRIERAQHPAQLLDLLLAQFLPILVVLTLAVLLCYMLHCTQQRRRGAALRGGWRACSGS
eukprot:3805480-Prymnesium_polylepis.1